MPIPDPLPVWDVAASDPQPAPLGSIARLTGNYSTVASRARIAQSVDKAAAVIADRELAAHLRRSSLRIRVFAEPVSEALLEQALVDYDADAVPELRSGYLSAGSSKRRFVESMSGSIGSESSISNQITAVLSGLEPAHAEYGGAHARRFGQTLALVPPPNQGGTLLELSSFPVTTQVLTDAGYWCASTVRDGGPPRAAAANPFDSQFGRKVEIEADIETQRLACDDAIFDVVMACEIIEHLPRDPMQLLVEANRVLRTGGQLFVTTPNIVGEHAIGAALRGEHPANYYFFERSGSLDRHHFEWTPALLGSALRSAGFAVDHLETYFSWWDSDPDVADLLDRAGNPRHLRGDNIIAVATKISPLIDRTPDDLYVGDGRSTVVSYSAEPRIA